MAVSQSHRLHEISVPPILAVVGETASGKSALGLELAKHLNGEIIAADSWTVYRGFDIGTAKPTALDRLAVPHHLIDIVDAQEGFNAALYKDLACSAIEDISQRGKLPILVGGTGLYVDSVLYDFSFMPAGPPEIRKKLNDMTIENLLHDIKANGLSLEGIDIRNKRRLIRLLETNGQRPINKVLRQNTLIIGLKVERDILRQRIEKRVLDMFQCGLEAEVEHLTEKYGWDVEPMKGIGYREWREYFDGSQNLALTQQRIVQSTVQLAKRQRTWFKRNDGIQWLDDSREAVDIVTSLLNN